MKTGWKWINDTFVMSNNAPMINISWHNGRICYELSSSWHTRYWQPSAWRGKWEGTQQSGKGWYQVLHCLWKNCTQACRPLNLGFVFYRDGVDNGGDLQLSNWEGRSVPWYSKALYSTTVATFVSWNERSVPLEELCWFSFQSKLLATILPKKNQNCRNYLSFTSLGTTIVIRKDLAGKCVVYCVQILRRTFTFY